MQQRTVGLLAAHALHVDDELPAVHRRDLAVAGVEEAAHNGHLVVLADGHRQALDAELLAQGGGKAGRHELAAHAGGRREVRLAALPPRGGHALVELWKQRTIANMQGSTTMKRGGCAWYERSDL